MESDWTLTRLDGRDDVALVTVELHNPSPVDRRVRVTNCLSGPVLPPRRAGVPERGWDPDGFAGVVPAGDRRTLGYACPAPDERPPVEVRDEGRARAEASASTAAAAIRGLDAARPPADALPDASAARGAGAAGAAMETGTGERPDDEAVSQNGDASASDGIPSATGTDPAASSDDPTTVPPAVTAWLAAAERRIERGEQLTDASAETVAAAIDGTDDLATLDEAVAADAERLRAVSARAARLAERAAAVDVPYAALRRLA
ncbi:hypothetical protein ACOZ4L_09710 [Haloplanus ruber]|uniref:DUF8080 domain-containing protein n=1 Tax=Haloplanus ruber TaxID=869892 RepID=A0ABD6CYR6_9EURY|nr:hypothetical protein [Haloplanus ruber]